MRIYQLLLTVKLLSVWRFAKCRELGSGVYESSGQDLKSHLNQAIQLCHP